MSNEMGENSASVPKKPLIQRQLHPVIEIVNGTKHYGYWGNYNEVLHKLDMTVYTGEVYALLGPHGCGKSTVLNVILGISKLNDGQVKIFGFKPGTKLSGVPGIRVGYTPQASGLYSEFTICETLRYYGALLRLKKQYVSARIEFLSNLLALPNDKQIISQCTEGNKRQISFAVALLHEPEVLILDEPCAGIDPLLRRNMWEYMKKLAEEDKAILVTTQSCEEARWANKIGFMRNGHLSIAGNPRELLTMYKEKHLETLYRRVFSLNLGKLKTSASVEQNPIVVLEPINVTSSEGFLYAGEEDTVSSINTRSASSTIHSDGPIIRNITKFEINLQRLSVSIIRDFKRCYRSYVRLILFILLPSIFLTIFCITVGTTPTSLCIGVVNEEASQLECGTTGREEFLSCQFLDVIDKHIIVQKHFYRIEDAQDAAKNLQISGIIVIDRFFTEYINQVLSEVLLGRNEHSIVTVPITLSLDFTSKIVAYTVESTVREAADIFIRLATKGTLVEDVGVMQMIALRTPLFGSKRNIDTYYMAPGLIITFIYHMAAFFASNTLVTDRVMKLALRNYLAGVQLAETIFSQMIVCGIITLIQASLLLIVLFLIFDLPNKGSLCYIIVIALLQIWCGLSFGVLVAMMCKSAVGTGICVFCSGVTTLFLCGVQWPLDGLLPAFQMPIKFLPQTAAIEAVRTIIHRGTSVAHSRVWCGIVIPFCWLLIFIIGYGFKNKVI